MRHRFRMAKLSFWLLSFVRNRYPITIIGRRPEFIRLAHSCMKYRLILEFGQVRRGSHLDTADSAQLDLEKVLGGVARSRGRSPTETLARRINSSDASRPPAGRSLEEWRTQPRLLSWIGYLAFCSVRKP
jgi:hypothetical protein